MGALRLIARGAALRCPACGKGRLYRSFLDVRDDCERCGAPFLRDKGDWTGGAEITILVGGALSMFLFLALTLWTEWPFAWQLGLVLLFATLFIPLFYRHVKGFWIGAIRAWEGANPQPNPIRDPEWFTALWERER